MNKHDIEELQSLLQGDYIEESTSRSLKEVKQHQKDVEKHADITDKAGFHRLVKRKMTTSKGHENATGASGVATAKTGTIDISLTSADFKIDSPAEKLFDRVFEIVKKWDTDKTTQISTAARKELFSILGFPDNQFDIYPNRCTAKGTDVFKIVKLVLFKSVGTGKVFPSVGYRFFHASDKPDIAKTGLIPSLGSTHGFIDQKTGKPTINRSYNKKACFFMAIKNNESLIYNIIDKAFRYGDYLYEYKPKRGDVFYEDLFSRPGHTSVMKDLLNIPGVIPVFINSNTPLPVKRIDKNIENRLLDRDKKVVKDTISSSNDTMRYISAEHKKFKQQSERLIKILETVKSQIKSANTTSELYEALWEFIGVSDLRVDGCDDKCYEIIKNSDKNDNIDSIKNKIIDVITKYQENIINDNKSNRNYLYQQRYKPLKRYIDNQRQEIQDIDRKLKSHKNHPAFESYNDENVDDDYITEANEASKKARKNAQEFMRNEYGTSHPTSMTSKQRNRMKRWLTDNDYDPKTGTIATDIIDKKTGKPVRVNVGTNAYALSPDILGHPAQAFAMPNKEEYRKYFSDTLLRDGRGYINMPLSEMKRHPSVSNGISKHEEGHIADMQYGEKMVGKRNGRRKLKKLNIKDYGPHINQDELAADVYSVQHNKYKDKLGFIKRLSSSDIRARKGLRHDLYKVYKSFYDGNLKDVDMTDINKLKTILKDMIKDSETELKDLKQFEKLNDNDAFRANVTGVENGIKSYKRLLGKIENITPDEFKGEFKQAVFNSYKPYFVEVLKVFDKESEFRADFAKRYIKEFAIENDMSTIEVIQEMYLQDMEDYVFQEDSESIESYIDETIERFDAFMEEFNNGQIGDSEFIMESARDDKYAKITRDYIKRSGRLSFRYNRNEDDDLPQEVVDRIIDLCNKLLEFPANGSYNQYKTYYDTLCKIVHHPNTTNISRMVLDHAVNDGYINFGMNVGGKSLQHRCHLKPGTRLYHTSENGNLSILKPNVFIGDDVFYAEPRTYFYCEAIGGRMGAPSKPVEYDANNKPIITDEMKRRFNHVYMYTVKPGDHVYFDNELRGDSIICSAVYLTYTKPIKLTKIY